MVLARKTEVEMKISVTNRFVYYDMTLLNCKSQNSRFFELKISKLWHSAFPIYVKGFFCHQLNEHGFGLNSSSIQSVSFPGYDDCIKKTYGPF